MSNENEKSFKKSTKVILAAVLVVLVVGGYFGLKFYKVFFAPNITGKEKYVYVRTGSHLDDLFEEIRKKDILTDIGSFSQAAAKMDLAQNLKPGR